MLPERLFETGEVVLNYAERETAGPPLVLLHGLTGWWQRYEPIIPRLPGWHIYACDLRGHGKSGRVAGRYHVPDYARDIVAFLRDVVAEPAVLAGFSLGGLTALATAVQAPLRALILIDPPLYLRSPAFRRHPKSTTGSSGYPPPRHFLMKRSLQATGRCRRTKITPRSGKWRLSRHHEYYAARPAGRRPGC